MDNLNYGPENSETECQYNGLYKNGAQQTLEYFLEYLL